MSIEIHPDLFFSNKQSQPYPLARGLALLTAIQKVGNLNAASKVLGMSYRSAWTALVEMESILGGAVVVMSRGKGSQLTELGQRLVWAQKLIHARFDTLLQSMAMEIDAEVQEAITQVRNNLKIYASHGFAIAALHQQLQKRKMVLDLSYRGSLEAIHALSRGVCDLAGFHVPIGSIELPALQQFSKLLSPNFVVVNLATRRQGIIVPKGNPKRIWSLEDLMNPDHIFVNRQQGSGTRLILDLLLEEAGKSGRDINGFESVELTHAAIAAYIASGKADAGFGIETAARAFDLDFVPILTERYFLLCDNKILGDARFKPILEFMQTSEFRTTVNDFPGYDATATGVVMTLSEAFPDMGFK